MDLPRFPGRKFSAGPCCPGLLARFERGTYVKLLIPFSIFLGCLNLIYLIVGMAGIFATGSSAIRDTFWRATEFDAEASFFKMVVDKLEPTRAEGEAVKLRFEEFCGVSACYLSADRAEIAELVAAKKLGKDDVLGTQTDVYSSKSHYNNGPLLVELSPIQFVFLWRFAKMNLIVFCHLFLAEARIFGDLIRPNACRAAGRHFHGHFFGVLDDSFRALCGLPAGGVVPSARGEFEGGEP